MSYVDTKIEVVDGVDALGEADEEVGSGGLTVMNEGMSAERVEEWTIGTAAEDDEMEEEKIFGQSLDESFKASTTRLVKLSSTSASTRLLPVDREFQRLDKALSSRRVLR